MKSSNLLTSLFLILTLVFASGCIDSSTSDDSPSTILPDVEDYNDVPDDSNVAIGTMSNITQWFSEKDNNDTIYALVGDTIIITLAENTNAGNSWDLTYDKGLKLLEDVYRENGINAEKLGLSGSHLWFFEVTETGEQVISGINGRQKTTVSQDRYELIIDVMQKSELINATGTVKYNESEGGFYEIVSTDDTIYEPMNLPDDFKIDGTEIRFTAYPYDDMTSSRIRGHIIEIRTISPIL